MFFWYTFLYVQTKLKFTLVIGMPSSSTESKGLVPVARIGDQGEGWKGVDAELKSGDWVEALGKAVQLVCWWATASFQVWRPVPKKCKPKTIWMGTQLRTSTPC